MDNKSEKKLGKRAEPTSEELEFIYERLSFKSNKDIVDDIQDETTFPPRTIGSIKRRRREFDAAKKVIAKQAEGAYDTDKVKRQKRHWERLAERAQEILNELEKFFPYTNDYTLAEAAVDDDDREFITLLEDPRTDYLLSHLKTEFPELANLKSWSDLKISNIHNTLLDVLGLKAEQQKFVGKCEACKDWE